MGQGRQAGFSLLELLVALFVVVLVTSIVSLSVTSGGQDIRLDAKVRNLADVASYALDEAQMLGRDYGLLIQRSDADGELVYGYQWWERELDGWREPQSGKDVFAAQQFPESVEMQLELEGVAIVELTQSAPGETVAPQIVLYASGETTPGAIDVRRIDTGELLWRLEWDLLGRFEVMRRGEAEDDLLE